MADTTGQFAAGRMEITHGNAPPGGEKSLGLIFGLTLLAKLDFR